jgi:predicted nucleotidyltransferase component of viral defense system
MSADPFQTQVARIALRAAAAYGFVLGGGQALVAHGIVDRPTEDIDLFTSARHAVPAAAAVVRAALETAGYTIRDDDDQRQDLVDLFDGFELEYVEWEISLGADSTELTLAQLPHAHGPILLEIGPVMHLEDLLASKVAAAASRAEPRDFIDIAAATRRYALSQLLALGRAYDPSLAEEDYAEAGRRLDGMPDDWFEPYGLGAAQVAEVRARLAEWPR